MKITMVEKYRYRYLLIALIAIFIIGTVFYHVVEKWTWLDAYYFSVTTLSTVGYGDLTPKTDLGKFFTTLYILTGAGIITTFFSVTINRWRKRIKD